MRAWLTITVFIILMPGIVICQEEFHGAYKSWANVKSRFGAKGDGVADDTKAFQAALDSLTVTGKGYNTGDRAYTVIYIPAGEYRITSTLRVRGKIGFSIIGVDPAKVKLIWGGGNGDTLIWSNGSAYFRISRITFSNKGQKDVTAIGINWKEKWKEKESESYAALNIELSDCNFVGRFWRGVHGGTDPSVGTNSNDSEVTIKRCEFREVTEAAISINGYNALDYWIWDCRFIKCFRAVQNKNGNYHIYGSYMERTVNSVFSNNNGYYVSVRGCYINGTDRVMYDFGKSSNPFKRVFERNIIRSTEGPSIEYYHLGKISFLGNSFGVSKSTKDPFSLMYDSWAEGTYEVLSIRNRYQLKEPWRLNVPRKKVYSYGDSFSVGPKVMDSSLFLGKMDKMPPFVKRQVFEVSPSANEKQIQALVQKAFLLKGQRPVIHFPYGKYSVSAPIILPEGSDMQFEGDGSLYASVLQASDLFPPGSAIFQSRGPVSVTFRDLQLDASMAKGPADGIRMQGVDQPGAEVYVDQLYSQSSHSISVLGTRNLYVQSQNSFFCDGNIVTGSNEGPALKGTGLFSFGAGFSGLKLGSNGRFIAKDCWWEGDNRRPIELSGSGEFSLDCAMIAPNRADSLPTVVIQAFNGKISFTNMYIQGALTVKDQNPGLSLLVWNVHFYHKMNFFDFMTGNESYKAAFLGLTNQCFDGKSVVCQDIREVGSRTVKVTDVNRFLNEMSSGALEAVPRYYTGKRIGISNVSISRLSVINCNNAIMLIP